MQPRADDPELDKMVERVLTAQKVTKPVGKPAWLNYEGTQPGGRLCAIGFSKPAFYAEQTFGNVVDDVRAQLAQIIATLVSEYQVDIQGAVQFNEIMTVASSRGVSEGVVVTHYWFDAEGAGPHGPKGSNLRLGLYYLIAFLRLPSSQRKPVCRAREASMVEAVRNRAATAFDELKKLKRIKPNNV